jgi:hypothetical protein
MHLENFVGDTLALTDILRQRFEQDKTHQELIRIADEILNP